MISSWWQVINSALPYALPTTIGFMFCGLAAGLLLQKIRPEIRWWSVALLVASTGFVVGYTLSPTTFPLPESYCATGDVTLALPSLSPTLTEATLNVLLFVPLGISACTPRSSKTVMIVGLIALCTPFAVETIQYLVPALGHSCSTADAVHNLEGVLVGLTIGVLLRVLTRARNGYQNHDPERAENESVG